MPIEGNEKEIEEEKIATNRINENPSDIPAAFCPAIHSVQVM